MVTWEEKEREREREREREENYERCVRKESSSKEASKWTAYTQDLHRSDTQYGSIAALAKVLEKRKGNLIMS